MDWTSAFLAALRKSGNVSAAARSAKITRQNVYAYRDSNPEFKAAWDDVLAEAMDDLEEAALKRAKKGSDTLLMFLLKSHRPEVYKDTVRQEHTGNINVTWRDLVEQARNASEGDSGG